MDEFFKKVIKPTRCVFHVDFDCTLHSKGRFQTMLLPLLYYALSQADIKLGITTSREEYCSLYNLQQAYADHGQPWIETIAYHVGQLRDEFGVLFDFICVHQDVDVIEGYATVLESHENNCVERLMENGGYDANFQLQFLNNNAVSHKHFQIGAAAKRFSCKKHILIDDSIQTVQTVAEKVTDDIYVTAVQFQRANPDCLRSAAKALGLDALAFRTLASPKVYSECKVMEKIATCSYLLLSCPLEDDQIQMCIDRVGELQKGLGEGGDYNGLLDFLQRIVDFRKDSLNPPHADHYQTFSH